MLFKGAQKKMIVIKTGDSELFEEAYFMMRPDVSGAERDMIAEANRIIENSEGKKNKEKDKKMMIIPFSVGAALGSLAGLLWLFL